MCLSSYVSSRSLVSPARRFWSIDRDNLERLSWRPRRRPRSSRCGSVDLSGETEKKFRVTLRPVRIILEQLRITRHSDEFLVHNLVELHLHESVEANHEVLCVEGPRLPLPSVLRGSMCSSRSSITCGCDRNADAPRASLLKGGSGLPPRNRSSPIPTCGLNPRRVGRPVRH